MWFSILALIGHTLACTSCLATVARSYKYVMAANGFVGKVFNLIKVRKWSCGNEISCRLSCSDDFKQTSGLADGTDEDRRPMPPLTKLTAAFTSAAASKRSRINDDTRAGNQENKYCDKSALQLVPRHSALYRYMTLSKKGKYTQ